MVSPQTVFTYPFHHAKLQILLHGVTANSLYLSFSPCKATNLTTWCHRKQSLLILFTMLSYKSYKHGVTTNSLYLSFSPCKATNLTTWCHRKQSLLILFTMLSYKSYKHGVTTNSLYLSFSPCKATNLTTWCHRKQSLLILFTMLSYKSYKHGVTTNSLYLSFSPCKATNLSHNCNVNPFFSHTVGPGNHTIMSVLCLYIIESSQQNLSPLLPDYESVRELTVTLSTVWCIFGSAHAYEAKMDMGLLKGQYHHNQSRVSTGHGISVRV